jgi:hypothetical protein
MPATIRALHRGAAATTSTTLYTVPAATTTTVTNIVVTNTAASAQTATISINGAVLIPAVSIAANTIAIFDLKQAIPATQVIAGFASATSVNFHISGVEVS